MSVRDYKRFQRIRKRPPPPWGPISVHIFTALGAVVALFAMLAVLNEAWEVAFAWLGVALVIDGVDGTFARRVRVADRLPRFSGERLDLVIDYLTYVFIPALMLLQAGFLDGRLGIALACLILLSSLYHFSDLNSKSDDHHFIGFPAIWNAVAFYLFAFQPSKSVSIAVVLALSVLTFVPLKWAHPLRVEALRSLTLTLTVGWCLVAAWVLWSGFPAAGWSQIALAALVAYAAGLALVNGVGPR